MLPQRHDVVDVIRQRDQFRLVPLHPEQSELPPGEARERSVDRRPEVDRVRIALLKLNFRLLDIVSYITAQIRNTMRSFILDDRDE